MQFIAASALMAMAVAVWVLQSQRAEQHSLQQRLAGLAEASAQPLPARSVRVVPADFTAKLPPYADVAPLVAELQRACTASGVTLQEVQAHTSPATEQQLAQTELAVQLRGSYPAIKTTLRDVQARYPHTTVRRLSLRRDSGPQGRAAQDIQADLALVLWARPLPPSVSSAVDASRAERGGP